MTGDAGPLLVLLDSNAYDLLADDADALADTVAAVRAGRLRVLTTHVDRDQVHRARPERAAALIAAVEQVEPERVPTSVFVLDVSVLGEAELADEETAALFLRLADGRSDLGTAADAAMALTAHRRGAVLVTDDGTGRGRRGLVDRCVDAGVDVMTLGAFRATVAALAADDA